MTAARAYSILYISRSLGTRATRQDPVGWRAGPNCTSTSIRRSRVRDPPRCAVTEIPVVFDSEWRGHLLQPARLRVERPHVRREEGPQKRNAVRVTSSDRTSDSICNARRQVGRACRTGQALSGPWKPKRLYGRRGHQTV